MNSSDYRNLAEASNGNVAIKEVPVAQIKWHVRIPIDKEHINAIMIIGGDP